MSPEEVKGTVFCRSLNSQKTVILILICQVTSPPGDSRQATSPPGDGQAMAMCPGDGQATAAQQLSTDDQLDKLMNSPFAEETAKVLVVEL